MEITNTRFTVINRHHTASFTHTATAPVAGNNGTGEGRKRKTLLKGGAYKTEVRSQAPMVPSALRQKTVC